MGTVNRSCEVDSAFRVWMELLAISSFAIGGGSSLREPVDADALVERAVRLRGEVRVNFGNH